MNLSLLKTIGRDIAQGAMIGGKAIATAEGYGPLINMFLPASVSSKITAVEHVADADLAKVDHIIKTVEAVGSLGNMSSDQKFQAATGLARTAFADVMSVAGHDVQDDALLAKAQTGFADAMAKLVQARVDFLNALKPK